MAWRGPPIETVWSEAKTEELRELWASGLSAADIAKRLGCGLTRNAVIGKAHRLKLERRVERQAILPRQYPTQRRKRVLIPPRRPPPQVPKPPPPPPSWRGLKLGELEREHCRWPLDVPTRILHWPKVWKPTTRFCGAPVFEEYPYCKAHCCAAYPKLRQGG